jgi:hypothetical protein
VLKRLLYRLTGRHEGSPLASEEDPRWGMLSEGYRTADARDVVEEDGVVTSGPGGTPQDGRSTD